MVAVPWVIALTTPGLLMVATAESEVVHTLQLVEFTELPSEKILVLVKFSRVPALTEGPVGEITMATVIGGPTVSGATPVTEPTEALIVVDPWPLAVTTPALVTLATLVAEELQVGEVSCLRLPLL